MKIEIPDSLAIIVKDDKCIKVWSWNTAPEELKKLSRHGGDEDWVAFIPDSIYEEDSYIGWMESGTSFGCCDVSFHRILNGFVRIGAHS